VRLAGRCVVPVEGRGLNLSDLPVAEVELSLKKMLVVLPISLQTLFEKGDLYFVYKDGGQSVFVAGSEGVPGSVIKSAADKIQAYIGSQPIYFLGLEVGTVH